MRNSGASVSRTIDLPPAIVWDALVDPELVRGWFHETEALTVVEGDPGPSGDRLLELADTGSGAVAIALGEIAGGTRGTSARVTVQLTDDLDRPFLLHSIACWHTRLDQLEGLLRGHPVDWGNWERDHGEDYREHLRGAESGCR